MKIIGIVIHGEFYSKQEIQTLPYKEVYMTLGVVESINDYECVRTWWNNANKDNIREL